MKKRLQFFNTQTRKKEPFSPLNPELVTLYTCGPTVYDYAHIGNFRTYMFEDLLRRTLKFFGHPLKHVMNLTDVDDKTIKGAIRTGQSLEAYTKPFKEAFFEDLDTLNIERAEHYPQATDYIGAMIEMIEKLLEKGFAYKGGDGSIYFAINKFEKYGCLSNLKLDELKAGASNRVASDEYEKECVADFVLWKSFDAERDGKIYWESPFGPGRPGWHLECSAMAMHLLGDSIDIHCGGVDNIFPHHENEIAQSEACSNHLFVKLWMHSEHLIVENKKMSKSLGNFYTLRDLLDRGFTGKEVRYMLLHTHYKTQLNFTFEGMEGVRHSLQRIQDCIARLQGVEEVGEKGSAAAVIEKTLQDFSAALADDLNISVALAALFELVRQANILCDQEALGEKDAEQLLQAMKRMDTVLGVLSFEPVESEVPADLLEALKKRLEAREQKDWATADELRDFIQSRGYVIEDSAKGSRLKKS